MGGVEGAQGIEPDSDKALFPNVDLEVRLGHDKGIKFKYPWIIPGIGSTNVAKNNSGKVLAKIRVFGLGRYRSYDW